MKKRPGLAHLKKTKRRQVRPNFNENHLPIILKLTLIRCGRTFLLDFLVRSLSSLSVSLAAAAASDLLARRWVDKNGDDCVIVNVSIHFSTKHLFIPNSIRSLSTAMDDSWSCLVKRSHWAIPGLFFFIFRPFNTVDCIGKDCRWQDLNCGPLVSETTALPTESQPLPQTFKFNKKKDGVLWSNFKITFDKTTGLSLKWGSYPVSQWLLLTKELHGWMNPSTWIKLVLW